MAYEDFATKASIVLAYTGEGKGKTSASVGLLARALGRGWKVAYIQFIKTWDTGESLFIKKLIKSGVFAEQITYHLGGKGFYNAGDISAKDVTETEHKNAAESTYKLAYKCVAGGKYDLVICDEINNAVHDRLLSVDQLVKLIKDKTTTTSLCVTGRDFPNELLDLVDIATNMTKIRHHFDDKFLANKGIDF